MTREREGGGYMPAKEAASSKQQQAGVSTCRWPKVAFAPPPCLPPQPTPRRRRRRPLFFFLCLHTAHCTLHTAPSCLPICLIPSLPWTEQASLLPSTLNPGHPSKHSSHPRPGSPSPRRHTQPPLSLAHSSSTCRAGHLDDRLSLSLSPSSRPSLCSESHITLSSHADGPCCPPLDPRTPTPLLHHLVLHSTSLVLTLTPPTSLHHRVDLVHAHPQV
ncbi:hypothetical protein B0O80DRAFT_229542 [Mortierella sp. GBAus27b]|nr:hypothetical protein B0O80DRAFT_229542 [Mortierella sp. GBAus27b]